MDGIQIAPSQMEAASSSAARDQSSMALSTAAIPEPSSRRGSFPPISTNLTFVPLRPSCAPRRRVEWAEAARAGKQPSGNWGLRWPRDADLARFFGNVAIRLKDKSCSTTPRPSASPTPTKPTSSSRAPTGKGWELLSRTISAALRIDGAAVHAALAGQLVDHRTPLRDLVEGAGG